MIGHYDEPMDLAWFASLRRCGDLGRLGPGECLGRSPKPINVLFLMTDQHHYQALGSSGNPIVKTPHLDNLAAGGTRFAHMYCPVPYCSPTRASIVTGRYPSSLGLGRNIDEKNDPLRLRDPIETYLHHLAAPGVSLPSTGQVALGRHGRDELLCRRQAGPGKER